MNSAIAPNDKPLFGGLAGISVGAPTAEVAPGVSISHAFAELHAPFLILFRPPTKKEPLPTPIGGAEGGLRFRITAQVQITHQCNMPQWFDRLNTIWFFVAMARLRFRRWISVPLLSDVPFPSTGVRSECAKFWPVELDAGRHASTSVAAFEDDDLGWLEAHWESTAQMMSQSRPFNLLFQACDRCNFAGNPSLAFMLLWAAFEQAFSPAKQELSFRVSGNIATLLEPPGEKRRELQRHIAKLYEARSKFAHGSTFVPDDLLASAHELARRILNKLIDARTVPEPGDLSSALVAGTVWPG